MILIFNMVFFIMVFDDVKLEIGNLKERIEFLVKLWDGKEKVTFLVFDDYFRFLIGIIKGYIER